MNKLLFAMTAVGALAAAAPAAAQYGYQNNGYANQNGYYSNGYSSNYQTNAYAGGNAGIDTRIAQLQTRLDAGIRAGTIDRYEADRLRRQLNDLRRLEWQYSRNGLTQQERAYLQDRIRTLRNDIRVADGGAYDRYDRYGSNDTNYGGRIDRNGDGWDDRDYDRDGRIDDNGYYGQGGPYEEADNYACERRGGIGGVIDNVFGRDNCATLRVGDRAPSGLYGVPYEYRNQYRDGYGYYYRSDGRAVYQIDARTNTVLRIYDLNR